MASMGSRAAWSARTCADHSGREQSIHTRRSAATRGSSSSEATDSSISKSAAAARKSDAR